MLRYVDPFFNIPILKLFRNLCSTLYYVCLRHTTHNHLRLRKVCLQTHSGGKLVFEHRPSFGSSFPANFDSNVSKCRDPPPLHRPLSAFFFFFAHIQFQKHVSTMLCTAVHDVINLIHQWTVTNLELAGSHIWLHCFIYPVRNPSI